MRANLKLVGAAPNTVNRKVTAQKLASATPSLGSARGPTRPTNASLRDREYVTADEVEKLIKAAKTGRWGDRDAALILIAYRHGLRAQESADLELAD